MNSFGNIFRFTSFGESHGTAVGGVIDGCPGGVEIDFDFLKNELQRRKTAQSDFASQRAENDDVEFFSGIFDGKTTGTPIAFLIRNNNAQPSDYEPLKEVFRPSHADFTYFKKYGIRDYRGGGRASARETAARVVVGAIAKTVLRKINVEIIAFTSQIGSYKISLPVEKIDFRQIESNAVRCPQPEIADKMAEYLKQLKADGDSIGGTVTCLVRNMPDRVGEPLFDKLQSRLASAMFSIPAVHGFDYGAGFEGVTLTGSQQNDVFVNKNGKIETLTNNSGGIQGGISNGADIVFRTLFKPVSSIAKPQQTVDIQGNKTEIKISGRHDACIVPRAVPVVEAMTAITILDMILQKNSNFL